MPDVAVGLEQEIRELVALAERVAYDDAFRDQSGGGPSGALDAAGMPEAAAEQLLDALDVPDEVRASMSEVVAHHQQELPLKAHLLILLLRNTSVTERMRTAPRDA